jgi:hypothetical protein
VSAAAAKGGGAGSARGRLVARNAVAVTCWHSVHLPSLSLSFCHLCGALALACCLRRADLFLLPMRGIAAVRVQAKADEAAAAPGSKSGG